LILLIEKIIVMTTKREDVRETISKGKDFYPQVSQLFQSKQNAALLYDDGGVTRANGLIADIFTKENKQYIRMDNGLEIAVSSLLAVNGLFADDYSEC
jgi:hypothetical protein